MAEANPSRRFAHPFHDFNSSRCSLQFARPGRSLRAVAGGTTVAGSKQQLILFSLGKCHL